MSRPLDPCAVGLALLNWFVAAEQLGHKSPRHTGVYMHPTDPEAQFVKAMMDGEQTADIRARWPGIGAVDARPTPEPGWGRLRPASERKARP